MPSVSETPSATAHSRPRHPKTSSSGEASPSEAGAALLVVRASHLWLCSYHYHITFLIAFTNCNNKNNNKKDI